MDSLPRLVPLLLLLAATACESTSTPTEPPVAREQTPFTRNESFRGVESNDGSYLVWFRTDPKEIPLNEPFDMEVRVQVLGAKPTPSASLALRADAAMPAHQHGMNRVPVVTPRGKDGFHVSGMLFHMPGHWELYFDVTRGAMTERAQVDIQLE